MTDLRKFRWQEKPDEISLTHAEELLTDLGALDPQRRLELWRAASLDGTD